MKSAKRSPKLLMGLRFGLPVAATFLLAACVTPPPRTYAVPTPPPQKVFVYPANGQSAEQTDRDRYECHLWAVQQTGVDPSRSDANPYARVVVQPANPPGTGTAVGAIGGAILGSLIAGPRNAGAGLVLGGVTGAIKAPRRGGRRPILIDVLLPPVCRGADIRLARSTGS
jgi:hypothetical protein